LFNHYDRNAQKAMYKGEIFPSDAEVGITAKIILSFSKKIEIKIEKE